MSNAPKKVIVDTSVMMQNPECLDKIINIFEVYVPIVVVQELDHLKTNINIEKKMQAKKALRYLKNYRTAVHFTFCKTTSNIPYVTTDYSINDDIIISTAYDNKIDYILTADFGVSLKAESLGIPTLNLEANDERYKGFITVTTTEADYVKLYESPNENIYGLLINEYLIIKNADGEIVDAFRWTGEKHVKITNHAIKSSVFGDHLKPKDIYQKCAIDSLFSNDVTFISGAQGSGKSLLSLATSMSLIEAGKYDRIVILFNPLKVRGAQDMGYYTGSQIDKSLAQFIGKMLSSKFGDISSPFGVQGLIDSGKLCLVPMADCRGMEINSNEILYISEAQNTSADIIQLCLSRPVEGAKIIVEGDPTTQVDSNLFVGSSNGMIRAIEVLKNNDIFGYVELQKVWRSKLAELIQNIC